MSFLKVILGRKQNVATHGTQAAQKGLREMLDKKVMKRKNLCTQTAWWRTHNDGEPSASGV